MRAGLLLTFVGPEKPYTSRSQPPASPSPSPLSQLHTHSAAHPSLVHTTPQKHQSPLGGWTPATEEGTSRVLRTRSWCPEGMGHGPHAGISPWPRGLLAPQTGSGQGWAEAGPSQMQSPGQGPVARSKCSIFCRVLKWCCLVIGGCWATSRSGASAAGSQERAKPRNRGRGKGSREGLDKTSSSIIIRVLISTAVEGLCGPGTALRVPGLWQKEAPDSGYPASFRES